MIALKNSGARAPTAASTDRTFALSSIMPSRPKFLDLTAIHLPLPGLVSIIHRISGALLFLALPLLLWLLQQSLASPGGFAELRSFFGNVLVKIAAIGLLWGFFHHLCAGVRFLALDVHIGTDLAAARASSRAVMIGGVLLGALAGWCIW